MKNTEIILFIALVFIGYKAVKLNKRVNSIKGIIQPLKTKIKEQNDTIKYLRVYPNIMYKMDSIINTEKKTQKLKQKNKSLQELLLKTV